MTITRPTTRPPHRLAGAAAALLVSLAPVLSACGAPQEDLASGVSNGDNLGEMRVCSQKEAKKPSFSITLLVTNATSKNLSYVGVDTHDRGCWDPNHPLPRSLSALGDDQYLYYVSNNASGALLDITYRVDGTEDLVEGFFQIPTLGTNSKWCHVPSYLVADDCSQGGGYHTKPSLEVVDRR